MLGDRLELGFSITGVGCKMFHFHDHHIRYVETLITDKRGTKPVEKIFGIVLQ